MSTLQTAPFLNSLSLSLSLWRWGQSAISCALQTSLGGETLSTVSAGAEQSRAGEPWQQGETQTQQPVTPYSKSHKTVHSILVSPTCHCFSPCHFSPPELCCSRENGWKNWAGWRWRSGLLQSLGKMFTSPSDLFWSGQTARGREGFRCVYLSFRDVNAE